MLHPAPPMESKPPRSEIKKNCGRMLCEASRSMPKVDVADFFFHVYFFSYERRFNTILKNQKIPKTWQSLEKTAERSIL